FLTFTSIYVKMAYGQPGEGEQIYSEYCGGCHNGGFVGWITGAPETGNKSKWEPFFKKGVDKMTASAIKGVGRMDPKGGCDKCSDEQIRSAVEYIMSKTAQ
ncbi:c-type cytochrome, partial [bacterium]|nr:c-type cytochrome [bacterium]